MCFVGSGYSVQVGNQDFKIDLVFFHRGLACPVAFELEIRELRPEDLGKLGFYLEALDRDVRKPHERPSLGVLLIPAFLGGRRKGGGCLYVSTGGFTKEARYEAERAETSVTLVDIVRLRQLVVDLCDRLDPETRSLVRLRHLYWPAGSVAPRR